MFGRRTEERDSGRHWPPLLLQFKGLAQTERVASRYRARRVKPRSTGTKNGSCFHTLPCRLSPWGLHVLAVIWDMTGEKRLFVQWPKKKPPDGLSGGRKVRYRITLQQLRRAHKSCLAIIPPGFAWQCRPYHCVPLHGTGGTGRSAVHLVAAEGRVVGGFSGRQRRLAGEWALHLTDDHDDLALHAQMAGIVNPNGLHGGVGRL